MYFYKLSTPLLFISLLKGIQTHTSYIMRVYLTLTVTAFLSSIVGAAPSSTKKGPKNMVLDHPDLESAQNFGLLLMDSFGLNSKRAMDGNTPDEKARYHLTFLLEHFRKYVQDDKINYQRFIDKLEDDLESLEWIEDIIGKGLSEGSYGTEVAFARRFYETLQNGTDFRDQFEGCGYTGSNLVEKMIDLNLQFLALKKFDSIGEAGIEGFENKRAKLAADLEALENTEEEMIPGIRRLFGKQTEETKTTLNLLKIEKYDKEFIEEKEASFEAKSGKEKKDCPAI